MRSTNLLDRLKTDKTKLLALFLLLLVHYRIAVNSSNRYNNAMSDAIGDTMKNFAFGDLLVSHIHVCSLYKMLTLNGLCVLLYEILRSLFVSKVARYLRLDSFVSHKYHLHFPLL